MGSWISSPITGVIVSASDLSTRPREAFPHDLNGGEVTWQTLFSNSFTPTGSMCAGIAVCPALTGHICAHRHTQAEVYYIIEGHGIVTIDGKEAKVEAGSSVFIPGDAEHGIRNEEENDLKWFYIFPTGAFEDIVYRFS